MVPKMATTEAAIANDVTDHGMIDVSTFDHSQLFLADNEVMKNDLSHQNTFTVAQQNVDNRCTTQTVTPKRSTTPCYRENQRMVHQEAIHTETSRDAEFVQGITNRANLAKRIQRETTNRVMGNLMHRIEDDI